MRLNCKLLKKADCSKYLESQLAAEEESERDEVQRINEMYKVCKALKCVPSEAGGPLC